MPIGVRALFEDSEHRIWMGKRDGEIEIYTHNMDYLGYLNENGTIARTGTPFVGVAYHIMQDSHGNIWIATKGEGVALLEKSGERFKITRFKYDEDDIYSLSHNSVYGLHEDAYGRIWVATFGGGLNYIRKTPEGKYTFDSRLKGMELGADDYIIKPFSATYLKARVENLLAQRVKLQQLYCANLMKSADKVRGEEEQPPQSTLSAYDRKFMEKLTELMEKNMDNGDLIVDDLVKELAVSRSVFFKKLKMLTGLAPIEFIKEMRVKRAAQLIENGDYTMTQIAYMVGINDPRYFSKYFKSYFGMAPTDYKEKMKAERQNQ
jgi:AraC-like DNA-binding protein